MSIRWRDYKVDGYYDELMHASGRARKHARFLTRHLAALDATELTSIQAAAELSIKEMGITFTVYSESEGSIDRAWPLDVIPRVMPADEWRRIEAGLRQRVRALNLFIDDIYHGQKVIKDGILPREVLAKSVNFRKQCVGV
ncbi:MAG: circularly permuted type 2 ATP-grasp protein, partial [Gammaproteobacteria bacterium]|nr:circularly permuted type 2 ATP-grasp protein [Gammaproteobacteria bacterium]